MRKILIAVALLAVPGMAEAATFSNGDFEVGPTTDQFTELGSGSTAIAGWTVGGTVDYIHRYWQPGSGSYSIDLSGSSVGSLSQTFDTTPGKAYTVSYLLAGNPVGSPAVKTLSVSASGNTAKTETFDVSTTSTAAMGWSMRSYNFVADRTGSTTLTFATSDATGYGPALDGVSLTSVVPEPTTWAMMIGGMGMIGGVIRRRSRRAPAFA
ncbi:choice-of-anchor C family PEP-CTERM protein [Sphingomonas profundi]|uniref:choice-of-anchor C family PEP-CTERM protein n=1 Tax=Alterirhizorhabdus profundi TaxID=2681549 RepID=UPI0018D09E1E|nr:choice-of-anchor C family protein [Sphingomonas profundi]